MNAAYDKLFGGVFKKSSGLVFIIGAYNNLQLQVLFFESKLLCSSSLKLY